MSSGFFYGEGEEEETPRKKRGGGACGRWTSSVLLVLTLTGALLVAYNRCVECVIFIAVFALLTINCIPLMPIVFFLSIAILLVHAIDYHSATIKVEVPLSNLVYVPSWDDFNRYVRVTVPAG